MTNETGTEIQTTPSQRLRDLLTREHMTKSIQAVLPKHLTAERIVKVALAAAQRQPLLLECTPNSFLAAVMQAAELGLEPGSALGHAYLVPFKKGNQYECSLIVGYRGMISLARRSGEIVSIETHPRYLRDEFKRTQGLEPTLIHVPWEPAYSATGDIVGPGDPGPLIGVYAIARLRDGGVQTEYMSRADVERIRMMSAKGKYDEGPWHDHYTEQARKTVLRRIFKYLPVSIELAKALEFARTVDGEADVIDEPSDPEPARAALEDGGQRMPDLTPKTQAEAIRERVAATVQAQPKPAAAAQPAATEPPMYDHSPKTDDELRAERGGEEPAKRTRKKREPAQPAATVAATPAAVVPPAADPAPPATHTPEPSHAGLFDDAPPVDPGPSEDPLVELRRELATCETPNQVLLVAKGMKAALATMPRDDARLAWKEMISRVYQLGEDNAEAWLRDRMEAKPAAAPAPPPAPAVDPDADAERAAIEGEEPSDGAEQARLLAAVNTLNASAGGPMQFSRQYVAAASTLGANARIAFRDAARALLRERFPKAVTSDDGADAWLDDTTIGGAT